MSAQGKIETVQESTWTPIEEIIEDGSILVSGDGLGRARGEVCGGRSLVAVVEGFPNGKVVAIVAEEEELERLRSEGGKEIDPEELSPHDISKLYAHIGVGIGPIEATRDALQKERERQQMTKNHNATSSLGSFVTSRFEVTK